MVLSLKLENTQIKPLFKSNTSKLMSFHLGHPVDGRFTVAGRKRRASARRFFKLPFKVQLLYFGIHLWSIATSVTLLKYGNGDHNWHGDFNSGEEKDP
jgi:hypothetical protein